MKKSSSDVPTKKSLKVAVVASRYRTFSDWLSIQNTEDEEFVWVHDLASTLGHRFVRVEKLLDYYEIRDVDRVFEYLEKHTLK